MLETTFGNRGGHSRSGAVAASGKSTLRTVGETTRRNVSGRVSGASGGSVHRVSGTYGGLVLRCVGGMLCGLLAASGCSGDGSTAVGSATSTFPSTTAASIATAPDATASNLAGPDAAGTDAAGTDPAVQAVTDEPVNGEPAAPAPESTVSVLTAPSTSPATVADPLGEDDEVFAAVRRYFEAVVEANDPPDPAGTLFDEVATPARADALRARAQQNLAARRGIRWPADRQPLMRAPRTVLRHDSIAVVDLCVRDSLVIYDLDSDAAINDSVSYSWVQLTVTDHFGPLLVSQYRTVQEFESEGPCIDAYQ